MITWCLGVMRCWSIIMEVIVLVKMYIYIFFNTYILINFKVVIQVHHYSSHIWLYGVKTIIVVISNYDSDLYRGWLCTRRRHIFRPRVVEYPSSFLLYFVLIFSLKCSAINGEKVRERSRQDRKGILCLVSSHPTRF